jgi:hypothetical protein
MTAPAAESASLGAGACETPELGEISALDAVCLSAFWAAFIDWSEPWEGYDA